MRYAIVGSGAVGGYYGAKLQENGQEVHFLYHSEYDAVQANGLRVFSPDGDLHLQVNAYRAASDMPKVDVVVVALKATQSELLADILPNIVHEGTYVYCLQNGLGNEEIIAQSVGESKVLAGAAFICSERGEPGVVHHYTEGRLSIGPYFEAGKEEAHAMAHRICEEFVAAGVPCKLKENGREVKWGKLVWNVPFSGGSLYFGAVPVDQISGDSDREAFALALMNEVLAAASKDGADIDPRLPQQNIAATRNMGAYKPSILVDFEKGRAMEIDCLFREPLRRGTAAGLAMPAMTELLRGILETTGSV
jgi:2-dehydropantoate 2-reductase